LGGVAVAGFPSLFRHLNLGLASDDFGSDPGWNIWHGIPQW
jgi:hypothetical protein